MAAVQAAEDAQRALAAGAPVESAQPQRAVLRDERGRWIVPPRSPGHPRGPSRSERLRALVEPHERDLVDRLITLARSDDARAATRAIVAALAYIAPPARPDAERIAVPGLADAKTLRDKAAAVIAAVANGDVSPEAGQKVLAMLDVLNRVAKLEDIEARLAALEGRKAQAIEHDDGRDLV